MVLTSRTFLFIFCALTAAAEGFTGGLDPKRLHLFKNAANHLRTITYPVGGKQHGERRDCHRHHHHGYDHHHQKHDHHHNHGHHDKHGHHKLSVGRAIYQDPYYHVSPQLFYFNKKPLKHAFNQYYSNKFSPYWFNRYNYLPYQMKPLVPAYNYQLKPLYYYLSNPQILTPVPQVTWIKPHHVYPHDNQVASEDSLSVADPLNNPLSHNVDDSSYEENDMTNAQIPVQDPDLDNDNNQSNENDSVPSTNDIAAEEKNTTPIFGNKININGDSTSYNNAEQTTRQYTPMIDSDEVNENSTPSVRITGSFDNCKEHTTTQDDFDRVYTTKSDDSFNFGVSDSLRTTVPSYEEKNIENSYSTREPIAITDSPEHDVTISNEPSLKDVSEQTVTYSPLEILQNEEILPKLGQEVDLEDSVSSITGAEDDDSNGGLKYGTSGGTTIPEFLETKPNEYHTTSGYDVTSPKIVTQRNEVDLFKYDHTIMDLTTSENKDDNVEEYKGSPTQQTLPQSPFEEQTTINSHFSEEASTFFLEPKHQYYTTTVSPKTNEVSEYEDAPNLQTLSQSSFGEATTIRSNFNDDASSETSDQDLLLFEEFIKTITESVTASPEISYSSELQSKTGMGEPDDRTTVRSFTKDAIDSTVKESGTVDNWRSITIFPSHTSVTNSETIPGSYVYRDLKDVLSLKTSVNSNSFETTTPTPVEKNEEESLKYHTVPVTISSISTDFDRDYEEVPAEKSIIDLSLSVLPMFTDSTEESENEFSKLKAGIFTTLSPTSIYTDFTEKSREGLSEFKFESNSIPITSSVYNDFTENYPPSTPSSLKIGSPNSTTNDTSISRDKISSDNLDEELLKSTTGNTGYEDRIDSAEITTNYYTRGDWSIEESIKSGDDDDNNNGSKVTEDGISVNEEKSSNTEAWNETFSIDSIETTTLSPYLSETKGAEFNEIENENDASVSKMEELEKQNISDNNIATEKLSLVPSGESIYDSEKYSKDYHLHSNTVTSKIDLIDFEVFQTDEPTKSYQEDKMSQTHVSSTETDFGNEKIESIGGFSESTTTTLGALNSSTAEDREDINEFSNNISDEENSATIFEQHGNNKNVVDSIVTTEPSYETDLNNVKKQSNSEYENKIPTTETPPAYYHGNLFEEIKNVILSTSVPSDNLPEVTEANLLYDTTSSSRTDQYERITIQPSGTHSQESIEKLSIGGDDSEKISGEDNAVENDYNDNNDHKDYLSSLELTSETNFNSKMNASNVKFEVEGEPLNKNYEDLLNEVKQEQSQEDKNLYSTSPNYISLVENNIDQTTLSSEAGTTFNAHSSNQENEQGKDEIVQVLVNDTVDVDNTRKVISELQSNVDDNSDGVIRVYEELDTSFPSSEVALQNENLKQEEAVDEETHVSEELEPVTEGKEQVDEEETTEILPLKQFHEPLFIENLNETDNQAVDIAARNDSMDEVNGVESSTRAQFSDFTEMESIDGENKGEEVVSSNSNSGNDDAPFHLDLLNLNGTIHDDSEEKMSNKSSMIEEVTYYNIKNLEEDSSGDNLFVAVNDEETNRTGLLSVDEVIDVNDDDSTNNYELRRSVRYEYDPYLIVSDSTLNVRKPYSNNINYQSDLSAKPRYIVKRDTVDSGKSRIPLKSEEFLTEKREIENESPAILGRDYQGEEALYDEDEYDYDNDFVPLSNVNPSGLIEEENEEEDDTKLTNDSGPSIIELLKRIT
ncbi:hypothetical protein LSTR_LSTR011846 [Laodelphax striatellus]|uniref:Uncharacterized protein n=1 Tax=Laodelphax striatellus TaxID=195883 RepID=A0A482XMB9_LAOST|nr:hypothetical protein LSTR_LSTR011846 [Laodelphax striatellus]